MLIKKLRTMKKEEQNELRKHVINYVIQNHKDNDDINCFFNDLLQHGCQSGMISHLIYYVDTHKFYDKYYDEIEELREEYEQEFGQALHAKGDLKNWFAWLGFEETARKIALELEIY